MCCSHESIEHEREPSSEKDLITPDSTVTFQGGCGHADSENEEADKASYNKAANLFESITDEGRDRADNSVPYQGNGESMRHG